MARAGRKFLQLSCGWPAFTISAARSEPQGGDHAYVSLLSKLD
jgi:hypothetical protein